MTGATKRLNIVIDAELDRRVRRYAQTLQLETGSDKTLSLAVTRLLRRGLNLPEPPSANGNVLSPQAAHYLLTTAVLMDAHLQRAKAISESDIRRAGEAATDLLDNPAKLSSG